LPKSGSRGRRLYLLDNTSFRYNPSLPQLDRSASTALSPSRPPVISATKNYQYEKVGDDEASDTPEQAKYDLDTCLCELHKLIEPEVAKCQNEMEKSYNSLHQRGSGCDD